MKYPFIKKLSCDFKIAKLCEVLGISVSGYYDWLKRPVSCRKKRDIELGTKIIAIHNASRKAYGSPRIHEALQRQNECVSRKRVIKLMNRHGIKAVGKRKFKATTYSNHNKPVAENLLKQKFNVNQPNSIWAGDITYVATNEGWLYLAVVIDLYSRKVVGWSMDKTMTRQLVIDALAMAYWKRKPKGVVIHHSDRGVQYASEDFQEQLHTFGFKCSMSAKGCCYDNAVVESFFHSLKVEQVYNMKYETREEAKSDIFNYIEMFYNSNRMHSTLGYLSPNQFEMQNWKTDAA